MGCPLGDAVEGDRLEFLVTSRYILPKTLIPRVEATSHDDGLPKGWDRKPPTLETTELGSETSLIRNNRLIGLLEAIKNLEGDREEILGLDGCKMHEELGHDLIATADELLTLAEDGKGVILEPGEEELGQVGTTACVGWCGLEITLREMRECL